MINKNIIWCSTLHSPLFTYTNDFGFGPQQIEEDLKKKQFESHRFALVAFQSSGVPFGRNFGCYHVIHKFAVIVNIDSQMRQRKMDINDFS